MKLLRLAGLLPALLAVGALPGCEASSKKQVAFVSNNAAEFWSIAHAGAKKAAADFDVDLLFRRPSVGTVAEQKRLIDALLVRGVDAISVSVIDPVNQAAYLNRVAAKVPLIAVDNDAPDTARLCYIGTDNYKAGKAVGRLVRQVMPEGGTIAIFVGMVEPLNARQRRQGVLDELAGQKDATGEWYGKYRLFGVGPARLPFTDGASRKRCKERADDVLVHLGEEARQGKLCMIGLWAYNPPAIYAAVSTLGLEGKVHIVGFDEDEDTLKGIKAGHIYGTVVQDPYNFGYKSVEVMADLARGNRSKLPRDGILHIDERVIMRDNVEAFHKKLNELTGK